MYTIISNKNLANNLVSTKGGHILLNINEPCLSLHLCLVVHFLLLLLFVEVCCCFPFGCRGCREVQGGHEKIRGDAG